MSRMIDLIRASAVPSNLMQSASKGSLSVPPREMIEILVHLAVHNRIFGQQAQITLAGWDETASRNAASDPTTSKEILDYFSSPKNLRPVLLPALLENASVSGDALLELAPNASREVAETMLKSPRITGSPVILHALLSNPNLTGIQSEAIRNLIQPEPPAPIAPEPVVAEAPAPLLAAEVAPEPAASLLDDVF